MFGSNSNSMNGAGGTNLNTYLKPLSSDKSSLSMSLWNQNLSLKIRPAIGPDGNGVMQYDKNRQCQTALGPDNAYALHKKYLEEIYPEIQLAHMENRPCNNKSVSVKTFGQDRSNIISIEVSSSNDPDDVEPIFALVVYLGVNADDVVQDGNTHRHEFNRKKVYVNYNAGTGEKNQVYVNADFEYFMDGVKCIGEQSNQETVSIHLKKYNESRSKSYAPTPEGSGYGSPNSSSTGFSGFSGAGNYASEMLPFN